MERRRTGTPDRQGWKYFVRSNVPGAPESPRPRWLTISLLANGSLVSILALLLLHWPDKAVQQVENANVSQGPGGAPEGPSGAGGRSWRYEVTPLSWVPRVFHVADLLTPAECDRLYALAEARMDTSALGMDASSEALNAERQWRTSDTMYFNDPARDSGPFLRALRRRFADALLLPASSAEQLQVARYRPDQQYKIHLDFDKSVNVTRFATLIVYLSEGFGGGETVFPRVVTNASVHPTKALKALPKLEQGGSDFLLAQLGNMARWCQADYLLKVKPRKGSAVVFFSYDPDGLPDFEALHGGCPVTSGEKRIAQQWFTTNGRDRGFSVHGDDRVIRAGTSPAHPEPPPAT